ncbi:hypothetical protein [Candidatus Nitrosotalea okcheonensis]|uniref:Uncharacterized protein n=1 Tax=Candidatus Nitrosotalea okcheonensis TaxID=1903276 RepID=A0A2H1FCC7_9ARCH|nr:hypothetical protein [Candidatus Nitrosotalea okcheonensis]SMH70423.1 protein of unknown function [Candidatus Nitrosotalea okcheonensis]
MSVAISLPNFVECKVILPNACWVEAQNDQKDAILLVSVPCEDVSSITLIEMSGKRSEMCFLTGSVVKIENNKLYYDKNRLEDCDTEE